MAKSKSRWALGVVAGLLAAVVVVWAAVMSGRPQQPGVPPDPQATPSETTTSTFETDFGEAIGRILEAGSTIDVAGRARTRLDARVVALEDGHIVTVPGRDGRGAAVRFPSQGDDSVAIAVTPRSGDDLTPGTAKFSYGADFMADGDWGDGDNVIQRGLFTDRGQYKLEIDEGRPACSIKGSAGQVTVRSREEIKAHAWYSAECVRDGASVTVTVRRLGWAEEWTRTVQAETGDVQPESPTTQLSIGAKTWANGRVGHDPDQFNGTIDNVYVNIG